MTFGAILKQERTRKGLTQQALAAKCGLSPAYIYRLEKNGIDPPSRRICLRIANALGTDARIVTEPAFKLRFLRWTRDEGYHQIPAEVSSSVFEMLEAVEKHRY
jgi:transcriptional regulator with XRE-family HTH domain